MSTTFIVILCIVALVVASSVGYHLHRKHQRMLAAMSPKQRELYEAEKEYKKSVKQAERGLTWAETAHSMKVTVAEASVREAQGSVKKHLGSYWGKDGKKVELYENRIKVPHEGSRANWLGQVEHFFESRPVEATVNNAGGLHLQVEGVGFASLIQCKPEDESKVREFALKINNASDSIHAMLEARERAVARARRELEATQNDRASIDAAKLKLEAVKGDTDRLDAARSKVAEVPPAPASSNVLEE